MSLVVVVVASPSRLANIPWSDVQPHLDVVANLLAGSLIGAWVGASIATTPRTSTLYRVLGVLLVLIAVVLVASHLLTVDGLGPDGPALVAVGVVAGVLIGLAASVMGVAGASC
ncbi:MAG TPA: TSUP family transporter [Microthrixaceae bacterium]|nr:TSUP family transporter [Microthrixaceae bacterium]HMX06960.1 TSUP family transporter [Microthrixaceae bacterium]HMY85902.1 TSUP family transporter [Microthrixaceae bacterium]HNA36656.1 TSUP family transporter [Microthrixaceae bacterium]HNE75718.1 TSUP family transporter [Microthrixaceae bacterium]